MPIFDPTEMLREQGQDWAVEQYYRDRKDEMLEGLGQTFQMGQEIYDAHRERMQAFLKAHGGIYHRHFITPASFRSGNHPNTVELQDCTVLLLSQVLEPPVVELLGQHVPGNMPKGYAQKHLTTLRFNHPSNPSPLRSPADFTEYYADVILDEFLEDDSYVPSKIDVVDKVVTTKDDDPRYVHIGELTYRVHGEYDRLRDLVEGPKKPDYKTDPTGYRRWMLACQITRVDLVAWVMEEYSNGITNPNPNYNVMSTYSELKPDGTTAGRTYDRCIELFRGFKQGFDVKLDYNQYIEDRDLEELPQSGVPEIERT